MTNEELIKIREEKNLTKGAFAKLIGISPLMQGRYESGKIAIPESIAGKVKEVAAEAAPVAEKKTEEPKTEEKPKKRKSIKTEDLKKAAEAVVEKVKETASEVKKNTEKKKTTEKKETTSKKKTVTKKKNPTLSIQSLMGGSLTTEEIIGRVLEVAPDAEDIYVKTEENKAYYTAKSGDGFIILWE